MFDLSLAIFLLLSPIIFLPAIGNITALQFYQFGVIDSSNSFLQLQFYQFGIITLFIVSLFQKKIRELNDKWLGIFLGCCLINVLLHPISVKVFSSVFLGFLLYKLVYEYAKHIRLLLFSIAMVSIINFIFQVLQLFGVNLIYSYAGLMKNPSHLGAYQALAAPICFYFNPYLAIIPIIGLLLTKTWTAIFAVVITISYVFRKKITEKLDMILVMLFMSIAIFLITIFHKAILYDLSPRLWIWKETLKSLTITGHGFNFKMYCEPLGEFNNPYNVYFGILYSLGIFSIPLFIWLYKILKIRNKLFPSCIILTIIALGQSFMDFPRLAGTVIVLFSLLKIGDIK